jgi:hypothetical protein
MNQIRLFLTIAALQVFVHAAAQVADFAPVGAKWHYSEQAFAPPPFGVFPRVVEVVSKEMYQGKLCSKLIGIGTTSVPSATVPDPLFVYSQNDSVFFYSLLSGSFELLYDFGAEAGESWVIGGLNTPEGLDSVIVFIDSVSQITVNGTVLKVLYTSCPYLFFDWGCEIIAGIGNTYFLTPDYGLFEGGPGGLRCYTDTENDLHFVSYPCDTTIVTTNTVEANSILPISISPNPASSFAQLPFAPDRVQVFNMLGQQIKISFSNETLDVSAFSPGIYQVLAEKDGMLYAGKLAVGR